MIIQFIRVYCRAVNYITLSVLGNSGFLPSYGMCSADATSVPKRFLRQFG